MVFLLYICHEMDRILFMDKVAEFGTLKLLDVKNEGFSTHKVKWCTSPLTTMASTHRSQEPQGAFGLLFTVVRLHQLSRSLVGFDILTEILDIFADLSF